ncbi:hypothetical protein M758_1G200000 [Ceratodon purpureus]|nr:hypothetical protein M758_1G200000 [Ceratodon purpureus]
MLHLAIAIAIAIATFLPPSPPSRLTDSAHAHDSWSAAQYSLHPGKGPYGCPRHMENDAELNGCTKPYSHTLDGAST